MDDSRMSGYAGEELFINDVVLTIADTTGNDPVTMTPLAEVVDPGALQQLVQNSSGEVTVSFEYEGHEIHIGSDGDVVVHEITAGS